MNAAALIAGKEASELLRGGRGLAWLLTMAVVLSGFALLLVSDTELSVLDNAQVVYDMDGMVTALGALLAVVVATFSIAGERERGSLVPLLLTPIARPALAIGKLGGQLHRLGGDARARHSPIFGRSAAPGRIWAKASSSWRCSARRRCLGSASSPSLSPREWRPPAPACSPD